MALSATNILECQAAGIDDYAAVSAVVAAGGTGYTVGDVLTVTGGTNTTTAQFTVLTAPGGVVGTVSLLRGGAYTVLPANPVATTGGTGGNNCTLTLTWNGAGNGGGFDPANANMATNLAATLANTAAPVVTSASYNFAARDVGHWLFVQSGTNWTPGWYKIASVAANAATLDAAVGHGVGYPTLALSTVAGCATVASPTGGVWSIDYSQTTAPGVAFADMVEDGTTNTKFTSAGNPVGVNMVGNIINVYSGTNWTVQRVQVVSVVTTTATCDKSLGTLSSTGGKGNLGGCLASPGKASLLLVAGNSVALKGTADFTIASTTANIPTGAVAPAAQGYFFGYTSYRGDGGKARLRPATGVGTFTVFNNSGQGSLIENVIIDGRDNLSAQQTSIAGFKSAAGSLHIIRCQATNCSDRGINCAADCTIRQTEIDTSNQGVVVNTTGTVSVSTCNIHGNTLLGISRTGASSEFVCTDTLFWSNTATGNGQIKNTVAAGSFVVRNCEFFCNGATTDGINNTAAPTGPAVIDNCIFGSTIGYGINSTVAAPLLYVERCAFYSCSLGNVSANVTLARSSLALTASPWTSPTTGDLSHNNATGGGSSVRGKGYPGIFPGAQATGYRDYGAVQHQEVSASQQQFQYQVG